MTDKPPTPWPEIEIYFIEGYFDVSNNRRWPTYTETATRFSVSMNALVKHFQQHDIKIRRLKSQQEYIQERRDAQAKAIESDENLTLQKSATKTNLEIYQIAKMGVVMIGLDMQIELQEMKAKQQMGETVKMRSMMDLQRKAQTLETLNRIIRLNTAQSTSNAAHALKIENSLQNACGALGLNVESRKKLLPLVEALTLEWNKSFEENETRAKDASGDELPEEIDIIGIDDDLENRLLDGGALIGELQPRPLTAAVSEPEAEKS